MTTHFVTTDVISREQGIWFAGIDRNMVQRMGIGDPLKIDLRPYGGTDCIVIFYTEEFNVEPPPP